MNRGSAATPIVFRLALALNLLVAGWGSGSVASQTGTVFIYLETPTSFAASNELSLAELTIAAGNQATRLEPVLRRFSTTDLAGRQVLLASAELAPAFYDSITVILGSAVIQSGVATVKPRVPPGGQKLPVQIDLRAAEAVVVSLVWQPGSAPAAGTAYRADLQVAQHPVPQLGSLAFVTDQGSECVMVIDRLAGRVAAAVKVGRAPRGMAYDSRFQKLYVAESDGIAVIDAQTLRRERLVPLSFGDEPERLALSPDERTLYVLNPGSRSLAALATGSMQEKNRVSVGDGPRSLAVDPVGGDVYVACEYEGEVQAFSANDLRPLAGLQQVTSPLEVAFAPKSREMFVTSRTQNRLQGFDLAAGSRPGSQSLCGVAGYLAYSLRSRQLLVSIPACREIAVLRPNDGFEFAPLSTTDRPGYLAFDPSYRQLLVLLPDTNSLAILESGRGAVACHLELSGRPYAVLAP